MTDKTEKLTKRKMRPGGGIYSIHCASNDTTYIGSAKNLSTRFNEHIKLLDAGKHFNRHLQRAWTLYEAAAFEYSVVVVLGEYSKPEYFDAENAVMGAYRNAGKKLFNIAKAQGGWGEETKARSDEIASKISQSLKQHYATMSQEERKQKCTSWRTGATNEAHRQATSRGMLGLKRTHENKANISKGLKGHSALVKAGKEHDYKNLAKKGDISTNAKSVTVDGQTFSSIFKACEAGVVTPKLIAHLQNPDKRPCPAKFRKNGIPNVVIA